MLHKILDVQKCALEINLCDSCAKICSGKLISKKTDDDGGEENSSSKKITLLFKNVFTAIKA
jgi:hypothetical protein